MLERFAVLHQTENEDPETEMDRHLAEMENMTQTRAKYLSDNTDSVPEAPLRRGLPEEDTTLRRQGRRLQRSSGARETVPQGEPV